MSDLQRALLDAFPPRSLERALLGDSTGFWNTYIYAESFESGCPGKSWDQLTPEFVEFHHGALRWMNERVFAALVPAYLASLLRGDTQNELPDSVLRQLTRREEWEDEFDRRAAQLTEAQRAVIARVLEELARGERFDHYRPEINAALASWRATLSG